MSVEYCDKYEAARALRREADLNQRVAVMNLGTRPLEVLEQKEEISIKQVSDILTNGENKRAPPTRLRNYYKLLSESGLIEGEKGSLWQATNSEHRWNGHSPELVKGAVEEYQNELMQKK